MLKKIVFGVVVALSVAFCITGCSDSTQTGGGGKQQSYDPGTGQYK